MFATKKNTHDYVHEVTRDRPIAIALTDSKPIPGTDRHEVDVLICGNERRWQGATFAHYSGTTDVVFRDGAAQTFGTFLTVVDGCEIETAIASGDTYETINAAVKATVGALRANRPKTTTDAVDAMSFALGHLGAARRQADDDARVHAAHVKAHEERSRAALGIPQAGQPERAPGQTWRFVSELPGHGATDYVLIERDHGDVWSARRFDGMVIVGPVGSDRRWKLVKDAEEKPVPSLAQALQEIRPGQRFMLPRGEVTVETVTFGTESTVTLATTKIDGSPTREKVGAHWFLKYAKRVNEKRPKAAVNQVWHLTREVHDLPPGMFRVKELYPNGCALLGEVVPSPRGSFMTTTRDMAVVMPLQDGRFSDAWEYLCTPTVISGMAPVPTPTPSIERANAWAKLKGAPLPQLPYFKVPRLPKVLEDIATAEIERLRVRRAIATGFASAWEAMQTERGCRICNEQLIRDTVALCPRDLDRHAFTVCLAADFERTRYYDRTTAKPWADLDPAQYAKDLAQMIRNECTLIGWKGPNRNPMVGIYQRAMASPVKTSGKWRWRKGARQ